MKISFKESFAYSAIGNQIYSIQNNDLREFVLKFFEQVVPDYFWTLPASSSGYHHPLIDRGEGGLVNHTRMVCLVAEQLIELHENLRDDFDDILVALLIHDTFKYGLPELQSDHTVHEHPLIAADQFIKFAASEKPNIPDGQLNRIADAVKAHSGKWTTSRYSDVELPEPCTELERFVHECDYIASREFIGNFDLYDN